MKTYKLGEIIEILDNQRIPVSSSEREKRISGKSENQLIPYYGATQQNGLIDDYIFDEELVLLGEDGVLFYDIDKPKAYLIDGKSWVNNHAHVIKGKKDILLNNYLCYFLNKFDYHGYVTGATRLKLNQSAMKNITISLPPLAEQQAIADKLDRMQELIALKQQAITKTDELAKSIFHEMFGDIRTNNKGWGAKKLKEITQIIGGSTPSTTNKSFRDGDIKWIAPAELKDESFIVIDTNKKITQHGLSSLGLKLMPVGTVLLSSRAPIGKVAITGVEMCCNQGFKNFICSDSLNNIFLYFYLKQSNEFLNSLGRGATFKEISKSIVEDIKIILPPLSLQQHFADIITSLEETKSTHKLALTKLEELYQSEMQRSFTI